MSGLELNKIAAAILLASLITMMVGFIANILYKPTLKPAARGYTIAVTEDAGAPTMPLEVKIDIAALMKKANAESGKKLTMKCISCHSFEKGGVHKVGPNLWNIVDAPKGKKEGYKYSAALINKGGNWDIESLFYFLHKPSKAIPGTKMSFPGLSQPEEIVDVIVFLNSLTP